MENNKIMLKTTQSLAQINCNGTKKKQRTEYNGTISSNIDEEKLRK